MKKVKLIFIALLFTIILTGCFGKAPTIDGVDDVTVFVGETFDLMAGVNAKDGEDDITMFVETEVKDVDGNIVDFNTDNVFVFYVTYTVSGEGNRTTTKERIITITISSDTTPPVISGAVDIIIETENNYSPLQGVTVIDDYDGDMTDDIEYTITLGDGTIVTGLYWDTPDIITVVYTVTDNAGNEATTEITVTVVDVIDPVITAVDQTLDNDITIEVYNYATALDNIDGDMTDDITYTIEDELGTMITQIDGAAGIYTIVYTAVDMAGNEATKEITITVSDITGPVISTPSIFIYVPDHLTFNPLDYFTITDETDGDLTSAGVIRYNNAALEVVTVMDVPGFYTFNITVTDAAGNETYVNLALNVEGDPIIVEDLSGLYASTQLSQYYADIFDSGLTTAEVCAKYIGDIPFEMIITNEECLVGLAEVKTIVTNHNVDEVITYIIDDETYYTATVTLTLDNLEEITFEVDFNFKGYEYDSVIYLNFITDTFIFGPQSVEVTLTEAQAALQEYYTKLIDDTYDITTFCNTYVLGAVNNEFTLEECITAITSIRGYLLSFTIDSVSVEVITPPEGDSFNGYKAVITLTTTEGTAPIDLYFAFFNVDDVPYMTLFGSPLGDDGGGGEPTYADLTITEAEVLIDLFYYDIGSYNITTEDFCTKYGILGEDMQLLDQATCVAWRNEVLTHPYGFTTGTITFNEGQNGGPPVFIVDMERVLSVDTIYYQALFIFMEGPESTIYLVTPGDNAIGEADLPTGDGPEIANITLSQAEALIDTYYLDLMNDTFTNTDICTMYMTLATTMEPLDSSTCESLRTEILAQGYTYIASDVTYYPGQNGGPAYYLATITATKWYSIKVFEVMFIFVVGEDSSTVLATQFEVSVGNVFSLDIAPLDLTRAQTMIDGYFDDLFNSGITDQTFCDTWVVNNPLYLGTNQDCLDGRSYAINRTETYSVGDVELDDPDPFIVYGVPITVVHGEDNLIYTMHFFITTDGTNYYITLMNVLIKDIIVA